MTYETTKINTENKSKFYKLLAQQVQGLLSVENDLIANAANLSSLLYHSLEQVNWVGVYLLKNEQLVLGPFQGQVACTRIPLGQGACGTAFSENKSLIIADVNQFKGHIACDSASRSELVIPLNMNNRVIGVLDIDSPILDRFDQEDKIGCENIVKVFSQSITI